MGMDMHNKHVKVRLDEFRKRRAAYAVTIIATSWTVQA